MVPGVAVLFVDRFGKFQIAGVLERGLSEFEEAEHLVEGVRVEWSPWNRNLSLSMQPSLLLVDIDDEY